MWPWANHARSLLVEAFPAAQLREWHLPYERYNGNSGYAAEVRDQMLSGILSRWPNLDSNGYRETFLSTADAIDSLICTFAAVAVSDNQLALRPDGEYLEEGWIAVHRRQIRRVGIKALFS